MPYSLLADLIVALHLLFVFFVALGGLLALRWPVVAWLHVPAAAWGAFVELTGRICPLTPLENQLRALAGRAAYEGDFVGRYLLPVLYPAGLTLQAQAWLGAAVIAANAAIYTLVWRRVTGRSSRSRTPDRAAPE